MLTANEDRMQTVTISLSTDNDIQTRAGETTMSRYVMEVYEMNGATATPANLFENATTHHSQQTTGNFTLVLDRTKTYRCLFWADNDADGVYNVGDLKAVSLNDGKDAIEASYFAAKDITASEVAHTITLKHAVACVNLFEKDKIKAGSSLSMTYTPNTSFSVLTGEVTAGMEISKNVPLNDSGVSGSEENPVKIGDPYYILAPNKESSVQNFKFELTESTKTTSKEVTNVPVRANYTTNIRGQFSDYTDKTFNVTLDENWHEQTVGFPYGIGGTSIGITQAGSLTKEAVQKAISNATPGEAVTLKITGPMNSADFNALYQYFLEASGSVSLDLSGADFTEVPTNAFNNPGTDIGCKGLNTITLPEKCTKIKGSAFRGVKANLLIAEGVTYLEKEAFRKGQVKEVRLGNVTYLGSYAFELPGCNISVDLTKCTAVPQLTSTSLKAPDYNYKTITLYVPVGMKADFEANSSIQEAYKVYNNDLEIVER